MAIELTLFKCKKEVDTSDLPFYNYDKLHQLLDVRHSYEIREVFTSAMHLENRVSIDYEEVLTEVYPKLIEELTLNEQEVVQEIGKEEYDNLINTFRCPEEDMKYILAVG